MNFIEACRKAIALESTPSSGNVAVARWLSEFASNSGFRAELISENFAGLEQCNLIIRPKDSAGDQLMLQTHLDTPDPGPYGYWTRTQANPFFATVFEDRIWGLGAADAKLDFLCKLEALKRVNRVVPAVLVGTFAAYNSMAGAVKLLRKKQVHAKKALVGEPTSLTLASSGQGLAVVEISIPFSAEERDYKIKHDFAESASTQSRVFHRKPSDRGAERNAIVTMLEYLGQLPQNIAIMNMEGGISFHTIPTAAFLEVDVVGGFESPAVGKIARVMDALKKLEQKISRLPVPATMNLGMVRTLEDCIRLTGSCHLPPVVTDGMYLEWMDELKAGCNACGAIFALKDYKPAFSAPNPTPFYTTCESVLNDLGLKSEKAAAVCTEASVFSRMGIECLVFGPGQSVGNSHAPNESIRIEELHIATEFYTRVLERFLV